MASTVQNSFRDWLMMTGFDPAVDGDLFNLLRELDDDGQLKKIGVMHKRSDKSM